MLLGLLVGAANDARCQGMQLRQACTVIAWLWTAYDFAYTTNYNFVHETHVQHVQQCPRVLDNSIVLSVDRICMKIDVPLSMACLVELVMYLWGITHSKTAHRPSQCCIKLLKKINAVTNSKSNCQYTKLILTAPKQAAEKL